METGEHYGNKAYLPYYLSAGHIYRGGFHHFQIAAAAGDIKKMYNPVRLSTLEQHTHWFLWRWLDNTGANSLCSTNCDIQRPSAVIATLALIRISRLMTEKYPLAADVIECHNYIADLLKSVEAKQVKLKQYFKM